MRAFILNIISFFYPPFRGMMSEQLFRYAFCGAAANALDILVYFLSYNFILQKQNLDLGFMTLSPHVAAIAIAFCASFPVGFLLQKFITFTNSSLRGRVQLFRYFTIVAVCIGLNVFFIKLLVEQLGFYPTVAKIITTVIVVAFSYFTQRHYSFRDADAAPIRLNIKRIREKVRR
ncbi:MAG: GtrA family protein [Dinghuibacter sp.]|nr:GtrA family protein [Dinghuibacter sp.]